MRHVSNRLLLAALALSGPACVPDSEKTGAVDLWPVLPHGGFVSYSDLVDLRGSKAEAGVHPDLWQPKPLVPKTGWERAGRGWHPAGSLSTAWLRCRPASRKWIALDLRNRQSGGEAMHYRVALAINGREVGTIEAPPGRSRTRLDLPPGLLEVMNRLELRFEPAVDAGDEIARPLSLLRVGAAGCGESSGREDGGAWRLERQDEVLSMTGSGAFVLPLELPEEVEDLELEARLAGRGRATLTVFALDAMGQRHELAAEALGTGEWRRIGARLGGLRGARVALVLDVETDAADRRVEVRRMRLRGEPRDRRESPRPVEARPGSQRPDVVVIVLDAARGDRFPGWEYSRQTVPNITRFAETALSFRNAFAECPTTSCSIPALITGVSFLAGGEVGGGLQLSDEVTTLAETLQGLGYRTVGFSASPNNSVARNSHQGFDQFRELWGRGNPDHGAFNLSRLASEVLRSQPRQEPLYLQLHYLPPHQPYNPEARFDRFTDPGYDGPIDPHMSLRPFNEGLAELTGVDLEHLIGLYDGNLLRADHAVGQVLEALRETGRWDSALVVITSDHGEAFMEHGRQGHNSSLFDEMLHVPLVVRLPAGEIPEDVDTDRLVSLLDVVPTILGRLGVEPAVELDGRDLLTSGLDHRRPRLLFFRTSHPKNLMLAARTPFWKAIAWPRHQVQMLFRIDQDPAEQVNLVVQRPLVYAQLGLRIRGHLERAASRGLAAKAVELSPEDERALRALGYLN